MTSPAPPTIAATAVVTCSVCGTRAKSKDCPQCGALLQVGAYVVERVLSRTDRGGVYVVIGTGGLRLVLKEMRPGEAPTQKVLDAFDRETVLLMTFSHPRVPKFLQIFKEGSGKDTRFYRVQQYVEGENLPAQIKRFPFEEGRVREIGRQVLEVLEGLHGPNFRLAHGNVKAANLILDGEGILWMVDFGELSLVPPLALDAPDDGRRRTNLAASDIYDFGLMMVHLFSRKDPAEFINPNGETNLEPHLPVSRPMLAYLKRLVGGQPHSRIKTAREAYSKLRAITTVKRRKEPPLWFFVAILVLAFAGIVTFVVREIQQR